MAQQNQKLGVPHFPPAAEKLIRRSLFLGANPPHMTFFAPNQPRDDRWCAVILSSGGLEFDGYTLNTNPYPVASWFYQPPTDWRPANSILTPPQCVHLNVNVGFAFSEIDGRVASLKGISSFDPTWLANVFDYEPATTEHRRLLNVAGQAKAAIEAIRPGKTWVEVNDYQEGSVDNGGGYNPITGLYPDADYINDQEIPARLNLVDLGGGVFGHSLFLDVPSPFVGTFYGTDFLGVYLGDAAFTPQRSIFGVPDVLTYDQTPEWKIIFDALPKTHPFFHRYSQILVYCDIGTNISAAQQRAFGDEIAILNSLPPLSTFTFETVDSIENIPPDATFYAPDPFGGYDVWLSTSVTTFQSVYDVNPILPSATIFPQVVQWGKDHGIDITTHGNTANITVESLVTMIARHFKFDPATGKDLG